MKKFTKLFAVAFAAMTLATACSDEQGGEGIVLTETESAILADYADDVILARYDELATKGAELLTAVKAIQESNDEDKTDLIATACTAWKDARVSWERTEAYLFGPVDTEGIDPGIDSWPLGLTSLQTSISGWGDTKTYADLFGQDDIKGFHAIEYVLFKNGQAKTTTINTFDSAYPITVTEEALEYYLVCVTEEFYRCVLYLKAAWDKDLLTGTEETALANYGLTGGSYATTFKNPGLDNAYYSSFNVAVEEAFIGVYGIVDEVAKIKITDPIEAELAITNSGLLLVESWFSHNSITDFINNIRGVKEAYTGVLCTDSSNEATFDASETYATNSLAALVASKQSGVDDEDEEYDLNAEVIAQINLALEAVKDMPIPFRNNLSWLTENRTAQVQLLMLEDMLQEAQDVAME